VDRRRRPRGFGAARQRAGDRARAAVVVALLPASRREELRARCLADFAQRLGRTGDVLEGDGPLAAERAGARLLARLRDERRRLHAADGHRLDARADAVRESESEHFRERNLWIGTWINRNFDGDTIERGVFADGNGIWQNYWTYRASLFLSPGAVSDRLTRGGPIVRTPDSWSSDLSLGTDERKKFFAQLTAHLEGAGDGYYVRTNGITLTAQPADNLRVSITPSVTRSHDHTQYVTSFADAAATGTYGRRYVFSDLEQHSFELATRADWTLSSRLSLQLYLQPFIASGDYHDYRSLDEGRTRNFSPYAYTSSDPDFNFRSVRGSAVARWEFRPGSALYVVWNENRAGVADTGDFRFRRDLRAIPTAPSHDVFLVKVSYWLPM
jgi:hypothetical protein